MISFENLWIKFKNISSVKVIFLFIISSLSLLLVSCGEMKVSISGEESNSNSSNLIDNLVPSGPSSPLNLTVIPQFKMQYLGETAQIDATGGTPPYDIDVVDGEGVAQKVSQESTTMSFISPVQSGLSIVRVRDSKGLVAYSTLMTTEKVLISPALESMVINEVFPFRAKGGRLPYIFSVISGLGTIDPNTGDYTASSNPGPVKIKVTDADGDISTADISVQPVLSINPTNTQIAKNGSITLSGVDGNPPYKYTILSGGGSISTNGIYSGVNAGPSVTVKVADSKGHMALSHVSVAQNLLVSPSMALITKSTDFQFTPIGGIGPFSYMASGGTINSSGLYSAPSSSGGSFLITVTDSTGEVATSTVQITESITFALGTVIMAVGTNHDFNGSIIGGVGSKILSSNGGSFSGTLFTAPASPGNYTVTVTDSQMPTPNQVSGTLIVNPALSHTPTSLVGVINSNSYIAPRDGVPPYSYSVQSGGGSINSNGVYTAPSNAGSAVVRVNDNQGNFLDIPLVINDQLTISPTLANLEANGSINFSGQNGMPPYTYSIKGSVGFINTATGGFVAGTSTGTSVVVIHDGLGNEAEALVNIHSRFNVAPLNSSLNPGASIRISAMGGVQPYSFTLTSGLGTLDSNLFTAAMTSGESQITVSDALGSTKIVTLNIVSALQISPLVKSILTGQSLTLSALGGQAPYTYSLVSGPGTVNSTTGVFSSLTAGVTLIRVTDASQSSSTATITTTNPLMADFTSIILTAGEIKAIPVSGGLAPYTYELIGGGGSLISNVFFAPMTAGVSTIKITDSENRVVNVAVTIASQAPTLQLTSSSLSSGASSRLGSVPVNLTVNPGVTGLTSQMLSVTNGSISGFTEINPNLYTFNLAPVAQGSYGVSIAANSFTDGFNQNNSASNNLNFSYDITIPTVSLSSTAPSIVNTSTFDISVHFSEPVFVFSSVSVQATNAITQVISVSSTDYTLRMTPTGSSVTVQILNGVVVDAAGNNNTASNTISRTFDNSAPTVVLTTSASNPHGNPLIPITATFNEDVTGFDASDIVITLDGNSYSTTNIQNWSGSGSIYNFDVNVPSSGAVTVTVSSSAAQDAGGIPSLASNTITRQRINNASSFYVTSNLAPSDNLSEVELIIKPKDNNGNDLGDSATVEVNVSVNDISLLGSVGSCRIAVPTCLKAESIGNGYYRVRARSNTSGGAPTTGVFTAVVAMSPDFTLSDNYSVTFDSSQFTTITADTTINSTYHTSLPAGKHLNIQSGNVTFDSTSAGKIFGHLFITGGTIKHEASTSTTVNKLDISVSSLHLQGGSINANGLGYPPTYSFSENGVPSTTYQTGIAGNSHGGLGGGGYWYVDPIVNAPLATYDNFKNPQWPGGGSAGAYGGGVIKITSTGFCEIKEGATITADGTTNVGGSAGGTINLNCLGFSGSALTNSIHASGGSGQCLNGCGGPAWAGGGGGGMVAFTSSGDNTKWSGSFVFPDNVTHLNSFKSKVQATGGAYGGGFEGAAGTVFAKHSGLSHGTLIVDNKGQASSRSTYLQAFAGTISSVVGNDLFVTFSSLPTVTNSYRGFYDQTELRPNKNYTNGTVSDWSDDQILRVVSTPTTSKISISGTMTQVNSGDPFGTIFVLDYLDVSGGGVLETSGDIYVTQSFGGNTSGSVSNSGLVQGSNIGGALNASAYVIDNTTIRLPVWRKTPTSLIIQGASSNVTLGEDVSLADFSLLGGTLTAHNITATNSFNVAAGTTLNANNLTIPNAFNNVATIISTGTVTVNNNLTMSSGILTANTLNSNNLTITSGTLTANNLNVNGNWVMVGGTVKHAVSTSTTVARLIANVTGSFSMHGGNIDVSGLGYPATYGFSNNGVPSTTYYITGSIAGASHGGIGGSGKWYTNPYSEAPLATYDNFADPQWPGGGSQGAAGGGVFKLTASGACQVNTGATIAADGSAQWGGSAGGTINLKCLGFSGTADAGSIHADGGSGQCLNGCSGEAWSGGGGGGMISLTSTGDASQWSGNFAFPNDTTNLNLFKNTLQALGGNYGYGVEGAAGTLFAKHSGLSHGVLIVNNKGRSSFRSTYLPGLTGTISTVIGNELYVSVNSTPSLTMAYRGFYNGIKIRPNLSFDNGTSTDWSDDQVLTIVDTPATNQISISGSMSQVNSGDSFATIHILDYLNVSGGAVLESLGDLYVLNSFGTNTSGSVNNSGLVQAVGIGGALNSSLFTIENATIRLPSWRKVPTSFIIQGSLANVTLGQNFTLSNMDIQGGTVSAQDITATSSFTTAANTTLTAKALVIPNSFVNLGSLTATSLAINNDLTMTAGSLSAATLTVNNFSMSSGTVTSNNLTINGNWLVNGGTIKHFLSTSTTIYRLIAGVTGSFTMNGGTFDVSSLGYAPTYGFSENGVPSTTFYTPGSIAGASHGGLGGSGRWYTNPLSEASLATYDNYRDPQWPGTGTQGAYGGGYIKISAAGMCQINNGATMSADGAALWGGSAGGAINLNCLGFSGSAAAGAIHANGGAGQCLNGCTGEAWSGGGGGGMVALTSTGDSSQWSGSFAFPSTAPNISSFKNVVQASGGNYGELYSGGAGTVFAKHSGLTYGTLILDNKSISTTRPTYLPSLSGTIASVSGNFIGLTVTSTPGISSSYNGFYNGGLIRPNKNYDAGTPAVFTDDQILSIVSSANNVLTTSGSYTSVNVGDPFATIHIFDYLDVSGGAVLTTNGDTYLIP